MLSTGDKEKEENYLLWGITPRGREVGGEEDYLKASDNSKAKYEGLHGV